MNEPGEKGVDTARDDLDGILAWGMAGERCMSQAVGEQGKHCGSRWGWGVCSECWAGWA